MKKETYENIYKATEFQASEFRVARNNAFKQTRDVILCKKIQAVAAAIDELHKYAIKKLREYIN